MHSGIRGIIANDFREAGCCMWWIIILVVFVLVSDFLGVFVHGSDIRSVNPYAQKVDDAEQEKALSRIKKTELDN